MTEDPLSKTICIGFVNASSGVSELISIIFFDLSRIFTVREDSSEYANILSSWKSSFDLKDAFNLFDPKNFTL